MIAGARTPRQLNTTPDRRGADAKTNKTGDRRTDRWGTANDALPQRNGVRA